MEAFYQICKSFTDPVLIIFILLLIAFVFCLMDNKKSNGILVLGLVVLLLYGTSIEPTANFLAYSLEKKYFQSQAIEKSLDVIIVLGGGTSEVSPLGQTIAAEASSARLLHGLEAFNKFRAKYFVCAGNGAGRLSEAEVMAQRAMALGVSKEKIKIDAKSNNTREHAIELNKMFTDKHLYIGVVTSGYHMRRSEREFKRYFKNVLPLPASFFYSSAKIEAIKYIPQTEALNKTTIALREIIGLVWYEMRNI